MTEAIATESLQTLAKGSRSFHFASHFLPRERREDAALLYAFCRLVDDLADEAPSPEQAHADLEQLQDELHGRRDARRLLAGFLQMSQRVGLDLRHADELVRGVRGDLETVRIPDDRTFVRYCYRVAGTVGLMMCPVLGVQDPAASAFALDLGVGMQITNICRDVREDAEMGRVYLPAARLEAEGVTAQGLLRGRPESDAGLRRVVQDLLLLAERYYASADLGMRFIPLKPRLAILVASRVYREIGRKLMRGGSNAMAGRTVVGGARKAVVATGALAQTLRPTVLGLLGRPHAPDLHTHIADLPGAHVVGLLEAAPAGGALE